MIGKVLAGKAVVAKAVEVPQLEQLLLLVQ